MRRNRFIVVGLLCAGIAAAGAIVVGIRTNQAAARDEFAGDPPTRAAKFIVSDIAYSPDGRTLLVQSSAHGESSAVPARLEMFDARSGRQVWVRDGDGRDAHVNFSPDGTLVAHASPEAGVRLLQAADGAVVRELRVGHACGNAFFTPDGRHVIAVAGADFPIVVFDAGTGVEVRRIKVEPRAPLFAPFVPHVACLSTDGKLLAIGGVGGRLHLWDAQTWTPLRTIETPYEHTTLVVLSPDAKSVVCGGAPDMNDSTGTTRDAMGTAVFDLATGAKRFDLDGFDHVRFSPDGKRIAIAYGGEILIVDASSGKILRRIAAHDDSIFGLTFAPDGRTLASAGRTDLGRRCNVKLWNVSEPAK